MNAGPPSVLMILSISACALGSTTGARVGGAGTAGDWGCWAEAEGRQRAKGKRQKAKGRRKETKRSALPPRGGGGGAPARGGGARSRGSEPPKARSGLILIRTARFLHSRSAPHP